MQKYGKIGPIIAICAPLFHLKGHRFHIYESFPGETRQEMLSRPVSSRNFEKWKSLVLSRIKISRELERLVLS